MSWGRRSSAGWNARGWSVVLTVAMLASLLVGAIAAAPSAHATTSASPEYLKHMVSDTGCSEGGGTRSSNSVTTTIGETRYPCVFPVPDSLGMSGRCNGITTVAEGQVLNSTTTMIVGVACQVDPSITTIVTGGSGTNKTSVLTCRLPSGSLANINATVYSASTLRATGQFTLWLQTSDSGMGSCNTSGYKLVSLNMNGGGSAAIVSVAAPGSGYVMPFDYYSGGSRGNWITDGSQLGCLGGLAPPTPMSCAGPLAVQHWGTGAVMTWQSRHHDGTCCGSDPKAYIYQQNSGTAGTSLPAGVAQCVVYQRDSDGLIGKYTSPMGPWAVGALNGAILGAYGRELIYRTWLMEFPSWVNDPCNIGGADPGGPIPTGGPITSDQTKGGECGSSAPSVQANCADPVNTATGNFFETFADLAIPGRGVPIALTRTYNSLDASTDSWFGYGWTSPYEMSITTSSGQAVVKQERGSRITFTQNGSGGYDAPPRFRATLVHNGNGTWTFTRGLRDIFEFDSSGRLTKISDLNSNDTTITYTSSTQVDLTDPAGRTITLTLSGGHVTGAVDSASRSVSYTYDGSGDLTDVIDVNGGHAQFTYDSSHRMLTKRSPRFYGDTTTSPSPVTTNHYDAGGRVDTQTDELGRQTTFDYTTVPGSTIVTDPVGNKNRHQYTYGLLTALTKGYGSSTPSTWQYLYDPDTTQRIAVIDPLKNVVVNTYDSHGNLTSSRDSLDRKTTATYNSLDEPLTVTDGKGITSTNTYDTSGNLLTQSTPWVEGPPSTNQVITYTRGDGSHPDDVTSITDPAGKVWTYTHDTAGALTSVTDPLSHQTIACYDTLGRKTATIDARGVAAGSTCTSTAPATGTTYITYDDAGAVLTFTDPLGNTTTNAYDDNGALATVTDANSHTTTNTYDAAGELIETERPDTTSVLTDYYGDGRVHHQTDAASNSTTYTYDAQGRPATTIDPLSNTTTYGYDAAGNLITRQNPGGNCSATPKTGCTTTAYNVAGQTTAITYSDGVTPNVTGITYDNDGQRTGMTDGSGTWTFGWDSLHRLKSSSRVTSGTTRTVTYGYDLRGLLTSLAYPSSIGTVTRTYDDAGRLATVSDWLSHTTSFGYDADNNLTTQTYPNGTTMAVTVDDDRRSTGISHAPTTTPGSPFASFTYTRDDIGQLTGVTSTGVPTDNHTWSYTSLNQLATDTANTAAYSYDAADNLTQLGDGALQKFNAANQLCWTAPAGSTGTCATPPTGATTYTYDTRGNRTGDTSSTATHTLGYDYANRLTSYNDGTTTTTYGYNADGLRTSKSTGSTAQYSWDLSTLPSLLVDGTTSYVYDSSGLPIEQVNGTTVLYFHHDHLGSTRALTDNTGSVVSTYTYDNYGKVTAPTGSVINPVTFAGEYRDNESGLTYLRARYYDAATGQFLTRDPLTTLTREPYGYAGSNPLNRTDPTGLYAGESFVHRVKHAIDEQVCNFKTGFNSLSGPAKAVDAVTIIGGALALSVIAGVAVAGTTAATEVTAVEEMTADGAESTAASGIETTAHGAARIAGEAATRGGVLNEAEIAVVRGGGMAYTQSDGAIARVLQQANGRFSVVVDGDRGLITTFQNLSQSSLDRLAKNYGWTLQ